MPVSSFSIPTIRFRAAASFRRTALTAAIFGILTSAGSGPILAQTRPFAEPAAPVRTPYEDKHADRSQPGSGAVNPPRPLTVAEKMQLARTRQLALSLAEKSDDNFRRGLLPLGDYLRQVSLSYQLRRSLVDFGEGGSRRDLANQEVARYQNVVQQLEQFGQPAAKGWAGDVALAHVYLSRAEAESAHAAGDQGQVNAALQTQVDWSKQLVGYREFDSNLGMAPPQSVIAAEQLERRASLDALPRDPTRAEYRTAFASYRNQLKGMAEQVDVWSERGAGIGRQDRVHQVRYELAQADAVLGLINGDKSGRRTALQSAQNELTELFQTQREFYSKGTASLFDLARTWSDRQSVLDQGRDLKDFASTKSQAAHAKDLELLETLADRTRDRRGRISADVEFVAALKAERELTALRSRQGGSVLVETLRCKTDAP